MGKINMNLLKGIEDQENVFDKSRHGQKESKDPTQDIPHSPQHPETSTKQDHEKKDTKKENVQNSANTKPLKAVMGFRAEIEKIEKWRLYASVTGQEIGTFGTIAIEEYISRHKLTPEQQQLFDLKKQTLDAEKKLKINS